MSKNQINHADLFQYAKIKLENGEAQIDEKGIVDIVFKGQKVKIQTTKNNDAYVIKGIVN